MTAPHPTQESSGALPPIRSESAIAAATTAQPSSTPQVPKLQKLRRHRGPSGPRDGRTVDLVYKKETVGEEVYELLISMYRRCIPYTRMVQQVNPRQIASSPPKPTLSLVDLYALFFAARQEKLIQQRKEPASEMSLEDFSKFYNKWKAGGNLEACIACVLPYRNSYLCKMLFAAMSEGYRKHRQRILASSKKDQEVATNKNLEITLLKHGVRRIIEGVSCIVIPVQAIPEHVLSMCQSLPIGGALFVTEAKPMPHLDTMPLAIAAPVLDIKLDTTPEVKDFVKEGFVAEPPESTDQPESFEERFDDQDLDALFGSPEPLESPSEPFADIPEHKE